MELEPVHIVFELLELKEKLVLSDEVINKTQLLYEMAKQSGLSRGRKIPILIGAAVYIACRETQYPRTLNDISKGLGIKRRTLAKVCRTMISGLALSIPLTDTSKFITRLAVITKISNRTKQIAARVMNEITKREIPAGKKPMSIAAAVLYMSCEISGEQKSQTEIANAAGISSITLRNRFLELQSKIRRKRKEGLT
jgi:transcription initiation factor TFIIB